MTMQDRKMPRLVLATPEEAKIFQRASIQGGLPDDLRHLAKDPLAVQERGKPGRYDHVHLSVPNTNLDLVQWWGRGSNGYHYPIGSVMRIVDR